MPPSSRLASLLGAFALIAAIVGPSSATASSGGPVRLGTAPSLPKGARIVGSVPTSTPMHVTVTLQPRDPAALQAFATEVSTPGSPLYRHYITPAEFAQRFGATANQVQAVDASLEAHGLSPGPPTANALSIPVNATAGAVARAFSLSLAHVSLPSGTTAIANQQAPSLDPAIASNVQAVLGLNTLSAAHPLLVRPHNVHPLARPHVVTGGPQPCQAASSKGAGAGGYTADQIASAYGFSGLYGSGGAGGTPDLGAGQTVAVLELESYDPTDITTYEQCYGIAAPVTIAPPVDGGPGSTGPGSGEAALDIENVIGLAPNANVVVYEGPNSGSGPYDTFSAIISQHVAQVVTASWGQCEPVNGFSQAAAENTLFQEAAAQGQTILSAAGDSGSEDCFPPTATVAVDDPASQPFITGVGGTRLGTLGPRPSEAVWNDGATVGAGGGGVSSFWKMPSYQSQEPGSLRVINSNSSGSTCAASSGYCREVPDVSADASPSAGYVIYWNGANTAGSDQMRGWQVVGGTSGAAPTWAALIALANASAACKGTAIGFANPALYYAAATGYGNDFNDVTQGNNDMTGTNGGQFPAGPGYDMATGLGSPNGLPLAASLCTDAIALPNPGTQRTVLGSSVSLQINASDTHGASLTYGASGLPAGLSINSSTGKITGRPPRLGASTVTVTATNRSGTTAQTTFSWTIQGNPTLSRVSLANVAAARPKLSFTLTAGRDAPLVKTLSVALPAGLSFTKSRSTVTVTGPRGKHLKLTRTLQRGSLVLRLRTATPQVHVTISYPRLQSTSSLAAQLARRRSTRVTISVRVTDGASRATKLTARVKPRS
jgi:subtilase family serine protease